MEIKSIGIVGAGQMGNGIAHVCALAGYDVIMTDISQEALDSAVALIDRTSAGRWGAARSPRMRRPRHWRGSAPR
jgi:3-hydroxyacyl-CoA dehydrogenase